MDRNTFTGLFLILVILVGSTFLLKPSQEEIKKEQQKQHLDSLRRMGKLKAPTTDASFTAQKSATTTTDSAAKPGSAVAAPQLVTLENKELKVILLITSPEKYIKKGSTS